MVLRHVPLLGRQQDGRRQLLRRRPVALPVRRRHEHGPASTMATSSASRGASPAQVSQQGQDLVLPRRSGQGPRPLGHRRERAAGSVGHPGDADQLRVGHEVDAHADQQAAVRRRARRSTTRSTRSTISRRSFAGATRPLGARCIDQSAPTTDAAAWNNPADHFSKLFTEQFAASYVTGSHSLRFGATISQAKWRLVAAVHAATSQPITYNGLLPNGNLNPVSVTLRIPTDRRNSIKNDSGVFAQDRWTINRATHQRRPPLGLVHQRRSIRKRCRPARFNRRGHLRAVPRRQEQSQRELRRTGHRTGRTSTRASASRTTSSATAGRRIKASVARYVNGVGLAGGSIADNNNPETTVGLSDTRPWRDLDSNGSPFDGAGALQIERAVAIHRHAELRPQRREHDADRPGRPRRVVRARLQPGVHRQRPARAGAARVHLGRLVSAGVRQSDRHRRSALQQEQLRRAVLPGRPERPEPSRRRRLPVCGLYDLKPRPASACRRAAC